MSNTKLKCNGYSQLPNKRPGTLIIFTIFFRPQPPPPVLIWTPPLPFINFWIIENHEYCFTARVQKIIFIVFTYELHLLGFLKPRLLSAFIIAYVIIDHKPLATLKSAPINE